MSCGSYLLLAIRLGGASVLIPCCSHSYRRCCRTAALSSSRGYCSVLTLHWALPLLHAQQIELQGRAAAGLKQRRWCGGLSRPRSRGGRSWRRTLARLCCRGFGRLAGETVGERLRWKGGLSYKLGLHWERRLGGERLLSSECGLSSLERLLGGEGSLHRKWLLAGEGGLRLYRVGWLRGLKGLLGSECRLRLGLLREKWWSRSCSYLSYLGEDVIG